MRDVEQGTQLNYAGPQTLALAAAVSSATHTNLGAYLTPRLWQPIGAADSAAWYADRNGLEVAFGNFNATPEAGNTTLARDRDAFWRGVVATYGRW